MPMHQAFWSAAVGAAVGALMVLAARPWLERRRRWQARSALHGKVFLIGAGPGDVTFLTIRARQLMEMASVCVLDDLVGEQLRALLPSDCELVYAGKRGGKQDSTKQVQIDRVLVDKCQQGHVVVRLKGGDPMLFGRVHSEIHALLQANCAFEIVPGISSVFAAAAAFQIPITHEPLSRSLVVLSGHCPGEMDFSTLVKLDTLVILMATRTLPAIVDGLTAAGRPGSTPVAIVHAVSLPAQLRMVGTLDDICAKTQGRKLSPAILIIGAIAKYADTDAYFQEDELDPTV